MRLWVSGIGCVLMYVVAASADNWPAWRGPHGDGQCNEQKVPLKWNASQNVRWKVGLPSEGNASPIVWKDRVFVTSALEAKGHQRALLCFARKDGKLLWKQSIEYKEDEPTHKNNPYCSATPVTDGERIVVSFGSAGLYCFDFAGNQQWHYDTGKQFHIYGNGSSPILAGDLCILWCGPGERQFLVALNKKTGKIAWRHDEPGGEIGDLMAETWIGSWSSPIIVHVDNHDELIQCMPYKVRGFDPQTGRELWSCGGLDKQVYASPVSTADGVVVILSGFSGPALAVKAGGKGDVTMSHRLWLQSKWTLQWLGSPVLVGDYGYIFGVQQGALCFDVNTGKVMWKERVGSAWNSAVAAAGRLYVVTGDSGDCQVIAAAPKFEVLAVNRLGENVFASVAISDGELFVRSDRHLWCIGEER
jgi:outer membrane protein assembly factor BamB